MQSTFFLKGDSQPRTAVLHTYQFQRRFTEHLHDRIAVRLLDFRKRRQRGMKRLLPAKRREGGVPERQNHALLAAEEHFRPRQTFTFDMKIEPRVARLLGIDGPQHR